MRGQVIVIMYVLWFLWSRDQSLSFKIVMCTIALPDRHNTTARIYQLITTNLVQIVHWKFLVSFCNAIMICKIKYKITKENIWEHVLLITMTGACHILASPWMLLCYKVAHKDLYQKKIWACYVVTWPTCKLYFGKEGSFSQTHWEWQALSNYFRGGVEYFMCP